MTAATVTERGRVAALARMLDACVVTRSTGEPVFDPDTGTYTTPAPTTIYTGPCEVQVSDGLSAQTSEAGGQVITAQRLILKVPMSVEDVQVDDVATITASLLDPDLVGQTFRVMGTFAKSFSTARRVQVEGTSAGAAPVVIIDTYGAY